MPPVIYRHRLLCKKNTEKNKKGICLVGKFPSLLLFLKDDN